MSDKKNIDNRKIIAVMCVALAFLSVFIMLRQVKIYKGINEMFVESFLKTALQIS